jgi:two-component system, cell cycle response regulator DivK
MAAKILVVEDNSQNRLLMVDILTCYGFEVLEAHDGEEGIKMALEKRPDLILLDMQMPVMDGITAARILKADPQTRGIKILAVTSFAMKGDRERILAAGADEYIAKPINTRELPAIVKKMLAAESAPESR